MDERHIVYLHADGRDVIGQYGRLDGYPTVAGAAIFDFVSLPDGIERLRDMEGYVLPDRGLDDYVPFDEQRSYGAVCEHIADYIEARVGDGGVASVIPAASGYFSLPHVAQCLLDWDRTGYQVFDVIDTVHGIDPSLVLHADVEWRGDDPLMIQSTYLVDLDAMTFGIRWGKWGERELAFDLEDLPDRDEAYRMLEDLENG